MPPAQWRIMSLCCWACSLHARVCCALLLWDNKTSCFYIQHVLVQYFAGFCFGFGSLMSHFHSRKKPTLCQLGSTHLFFFKIVFPSPHWLEQKPWSPVILTGSCLACASSSAFPRINCCPAHGWWNFQQPSVFPGQAAPQRQQGWAGTLLPPLPLAALAVCLLQGWIPTTLANLHHWLKRPFPQEDGRETELVIGNGVTTPVLCTVSSSWTKVQKQPQPIH